ncbi:MAG: TatD family hydrolase [Promethearchaeota archaeon]|nr:MAG: TatD family hydrolase [Candidatus Lokiarchaeota archaeon]
MIKLYIDCHAHIFFSPIPIESIDEDITGTIPIPTISFINQMLSNAREKGVKYIIGVISNPKDFTSYQKQLEFEDVIHIIGISRNKALENHLEMLTLLEKEIERKKPHGIGEIGLEYLYGIDQLNDNEKNIFMKKQQELLKKQIRLAKENDIPIVVHAGYGTDKDIVEILKQEKVQDVGGQIHGYMSKKELVSELLDLGFYFSFGYPHPRDDEMKKIIEITPLEQLLTETDSPYHIMENPKKFILPEDVVLVTKDIAILKEINFKDFTNQVIKNARELFRF